MQDSVSIEISYVLGTTTSQSTIFRMHGPLSDGHAGTFDFLILLYDRVSFNFMSGS